MNSRTSFQDDAPLGYLIFDVARLLRRHFEDEAKAHDITLPQWRALAALVKHGAKTQVMLANEIDADPMTVSGLLERMEKRGLVSRKPNPADSRAKLAEATDEGHRIFDAIKRRGLTRYEAALAGLAPHETQALEHALTKIRHNLADLAVPEDVTT